MAGNARFESTLSSLEQGFVGNYPNGQRVNYPGPGLDRSGSFREGGNSRIFGSGTGVSRGSGMLTGDLPPLSHCLMLEQLMMGDPKSTGAGELRRVLGFFFGTASEENSSGAAHSKPSPPVATDELKRYKENLMDGCIKARDRAKALDEHLHKLDKYCEAINSKKQQRNELLTNERSGGLNLKMGTQIHRIPPDLVRQRPEDRAKNVVLNKRVRTSVAEPRAECRSNGLPRQPLGMAKDRDMLKDSDAGSDMVQEKIHRLPAGGEGWDKKMKRKRSVGTVFTRAVDSDGELKRSMHQKLSTEPGLRSCDSHGVRLVSSNGISGTNKLDSTSSPASSNTRATPKNELEKPAIPRDFTAGLNKERLLAKGNKLNIREDNHMAGPSTVTKGKASRALRTGSAVATNSSPNNARASGALESWEQVPSVNKIQLVGGANNRKRPMASGSSSPPITQWVGQRPQKISRTRRANLVSPVSNHDEMSEGCSPSDFGARITSSETNSSLLSRGVANGAQQLKVKAESIPSPARLSESEESGAGKKRLKEKGMGSGEVEQKAINAVKNVGSSVMLTKKSKLLIKEQIGDGVRRQGRSGRGSSFSRASISPIREKLENAATTKPLRSTRPNFDKNESKSGRPLKKLSNRKGFSRLGHTLNSGSPDFIGELDDDREELLVAANFACNASYLACSSPFWKKMEPLFTSVSLEETSYLLQQLKSAEELHERLSQMFGHGNNILGDLVHGEISVSDTLVAGERDRNMQNQINSNESARMVNLVDQFQDVETLSGNFKKVTPLYQRVLSALIAEDEIEEFEENDMRRNVSLQFAADDSPYNSCLSVDAELRKRDRMDFKCESSFGVQTKKQFTANIFFPCNGSNTSDRSPDIQNLPCCDELVQGNGRFVHSEVGVLAGISRNDMDGPKRQMDSFDISSFECQYEQICLNDKLLLELQSIGLYLETVPDLDDREDEEINQDIVQLNKGLYQQIGKKKVCLDKIYKAIQGGREAERRDLEQVAMTKLVELAYKKQLATKGSFASKTGVAKVSKQVALAFSKRTLERCQKFEDSGISCFSEPALQDIIFAAPPRGNEAEPLNFVGPAVANSKHRDSHNPQPDSTTSGSFAGTAERRSHHNKIDSASLDEFESSTPQSDDAFAKKGPISNRGKKKEVLLDDVSGSATLRTPSTLGGPVLGGTKGKRSERERDKGTSTRNSVAKSGRSLVVNVKGERKTKTKPKKTAHLSASGNGLVTKFTETTHPVYPSTGSGELVSNSRDRKREVGLISPGSIPQDSSKEIKDNLGFTNLQLHESDSIEELGVGPDFGGPQDFNSWFNFDEDGLQDHDLVGLEIPMDDLTQLNMF